MWKHDDGWIVEKWQSVVTVDERQVRRTQVVILPRAFWQGGGRHKHLQHLHVLIQEEVPLSSLLVLWGGEANDAYSAASPKVVRRKSR